MIDPLNVKLKEEHHSNMVLYINLVPFRMWLLLVKALKL